LWSVRDDVTQKLMIDFYDNLWNKGLSRLEALRQAQIAMLSDGLRDTRLLDIADATNRGIDFVEGQQPLDGRRLPPYYWAGFVLSGDWE
jgi:CHAT domain-containing protein